MILFCHPGGSGFIYDVFRCLHAAKSDATFFTCSYFPQWIADLAKVCDTLTGSDLRAHVYRRRAAETADSCVMSTWSAEFLAAMKTMSMASTEYCFERNAAFERFAEKKIEHLKPKIVITHQGLSDHLIQAARRVNAQVYLHQEIAHDSAYRDLLLNAKEKLNWSMAGRTERQLLDAPYYPDLKHERSDYILAPSEYVANSLERLGVDSGRIKRMFYAINLDMFRPAERKKRKTKKVLFCGNISFRKGIDTIVKVARLLKTENIKFVAYGHFGLAERCRKELGSVITVMPPLPRNRLSHIYNSSDVFLFPTLHEGSALVTYEAMACGLPVVTTDRSGAVVRHGKDGFIVPPFDEEQTAARVLQLLNDDTLRAEMGRSAYERASEFSFAALTERFSKIFEKKS